MKTHTNPDADFEACGDMRLTDDMLPILTVYESPADFPGKTVVRRTDCYRVEFHVWKSQAVFDSLTGARHWIRRTYPQLVQVGRFPEDERQIVEVWL